MCEMAVTGHDPGQHWKAFCYLPWLFTAHAACVGVYQHGLIQEYLANTCLITRLDHY